MPSPDMFYREYITRTHRTLAAYLSLFAWTRGLDCVVLDRHEIVRFWGIAKRVEDQRIDWLKEDIKEYFPHLKALYSNNATKFGSVFLSRKEFPSSSFSESISDKKRAEWLTANGIVTAIVKLPSDVKMLTQLASIIHGLASTPLREKDNDRSTQHTDGPLPKL